MAIGDRYKLTAVGSFLGAPVTFSCSYQQVQANAGGAGNEEADLSNDFFNADNGPFTFLRQIISEDCTFQAAVIRAAQRSVSVGLNGVVGANTGEPLTSDTSVMIEIIPFWPNPAFKVGRIYLPGITKSSSWLGGVRGGVEETIFGGEDRIINLRRFGTSTTTWRLLPSINFVADPAAPGSLTSVFARYLRIDPIMRRLSSRKTSVVAALGAADGIIPGLPVSEYVADEEEIDPDGGIDPPLMPEE